MRNKKESVEKRNSEQRAIEEERRNTEKEAMNYQIDKLKFLFYIVSAFKLIVGGPSRLILPLNT